LANSHTATATTTTTVQFCLSGQFLNITPGSTTLSNKKLVVIFEDGAEHVT